MLKKSGIDCGRCSVVIHWIPLICGRDGDDGRSGGIGSTVLRLLPRRPCPRRSSLSSTSPIGRTVDSPARTSPSIPNATVTCALQARNWSSSDAPTQPHEAASRPRGQGSIAPANWIATSANSKPNTAPTLLPARSHGIYMKTPATWPVRTPPLLNTWSLSPSQESRDAVRPSQAESTLTRSRLRGPNGANDEFLLAATAQNLRRLARLRPDRMLDGFFNGIRQKRPFPTTGELVRLLAELEPLRRIETKFPSAGNARASLTTRR
jgi:hypothetical protein